MSVTESVVQLAPSSKRAEAQGVEFKLTPTQQIAFDRLERVIVAAPVVGLMGAPGSGKSIILSRIAAKQGGTVITAVEMADIAAAVPATSFETAIGEAIVEALRTYPMVVVDDLRYLVAPGSNASSRPGFVRAVLQRLRVLATASGHRLLFAGHIPESWEAPADQFGPQAAVVQLGSFGPEDYSVIAQTLAGEERVAAVDFAAVHRFAGHLNGYQLTLALAMLDDCSQLDTDTVIGSLKANVMVSNTRVDEVEGVTFDQLPGHEEIIEALQANIVLPMENRELAHRMGLKPKRGVLLFGPPGTGKTSIGRALAHHMRGKFFMIDGSFVSEPPGAFFAKVERVVQEAKENAPSVLFIDDADVLFQIDHIAGLSRYLLSLLDGIESETASGVCVMMTAMNVRPIPEALLRSGRVELWLETKPPTEAVRQSILERWTKDAHEAFANIDLAALAAATDGFTPADLRRLVNDGKALFAADMVRDKPLRPATDYFRDAVTEIISVRNRMADSLGDPQLRLAARGSDRYGQNAHEGEQGW